MSTQLQESVKTLSTSPDSTLQSSDLSTTRQDLVRNMLEGERRDSPRVPHTARPGPRR